MPSNSLSLLSLEYLWGPVWAFSSLMSGCDTSVLDRGDILEQVAKRSKVRLAHLVCFFCVSDEVIENKTNGLELPRYMYGLDM